MDCCADPEVQRTLRKNRIINKQLAEEGKKQHAKILLLGAGESGKSTVAKQMKIIHLEGFKEEERFSFKSIIYKNTIYSMRLLLKKANEFVEVDPLYNLLSDNKAYAERILDKGDPHFGGPEPSLHPEDAALIKSLWNDPAIQATFIRSSEYQLNDSAAYFFMNVDNTSQVNFSPSDQDILRARVRTSGIIEINFSLDGIIFSVVDVGGQRSERRKWIHCFQDVTAVLFCVDLSGYDRKLFEDETVNRMHESLQLFRDIANGDWFVKTAMILFLNKKDIFLEKIVKVPLTVCFPEYKGANTIDEASDYISKRFKEQKIKNVNGKNNEIYVHMTCATDTENIKYIFLAVKVIILNAMLEVIF